MPGPSKRLLVFPDLESIDALPALLREELEGRFKFAVSESAVPRRSGVDEVAALDTISRLGEGVGIVDRSGEVLWMNARLSSAEPELLRNFADACVEGLSEIERAAEEAAVRGDPGGEPGSVRAQISGARAEYEVVVAVLPVPGGGRSRVIGLMLDITASQRLQRRIEEVDAAGGELLEVDSGMVSLSVTDRLRTLERKVLDGIEAIVGVGSCEVRVLDRRSGQLELVMTREIAPLPIGQRLFARESGQGISGLVAATGRGYVCRDAANDPLYAPGLAGARSSVTVPIRRGEALVGILNVESTEPERFDEEDRLCLELYGRYIGLAMTILDMLVVERFTTNRQVAETVLNELQAPLAAIRLDAERLREQHPAAAMLARGILESVAAVEARLRTSTSGPQSILGADEFLREAILDRTLAGREVLVADDEPEIRQTIRAVLERKGCTVVICSDGAAAIEAIAAREAAACSPFDLVISDVRMPDRNGYEVFRAAKDAGKETPVILMTGFGYDPHHSIVRSSQEGLHCFLFKPFQVRQLLEEVQKALLENQPG
jgi:CheY-like chemotaxis protein